MSIKDLIASEAAAVEEAETTGVQHRNLTDVTITRGLPRTRTLQIRLSEDEWIAIEGQAAASGLAVSTLARNILVPAVKPVTALADAVAQLETDVRALRNLVAV